VATGAAGSTNPYGSLQYSNGQLATGLGSATGGYSGTSNMLQQGVNTAQGLANSVYQSSSSRLLSRTRCQAAAAAAVVHGNMPARTPTHLAPLIQPQVTA
jgi:hypothetical protein